MEQPFSRTDVSPQPTLAKVSATLSVEAESRAGELLTDNDELIARRLRWRARRGLLENDLLLTRFLDRRERDLSSGELANLTKLLLLPDQELLDLLLNRADLKSELDSQEMRALLSDLRCS